MTRYILISLVLLLASCSKPDTPEVIVEKFYTTSDYNMLSSADKQAMTAQEWAELGDYSHLFKPKLSPTNRYFALEQFLYSHSSVTVRQHTVDGDKKLVKVNFKHPALLIELGFFTEDALRVFKDEIEQANVNFEKGLITAATLQFKENEETFTLLNDGIFLNLAAVQESKKKYRDIEKLRDSFKVLNAYTLKNITHFEFHKADYRKAVEELRQIGHQQVIADYEASADAMKSLVELDPEITIYSELGYAADAFRRVIMVKADNYFKDQLVISDDKVSESTTGEKALFFQWELKSPGTENLYGASAAFSATFFDAGGRKVGYQEMYFKDGPRGDGIVAGTVGAKIESQSAAENSSRVEVKYLHPINLPMMKCSFNGQLSCARFSAD